MKKKLKIYAIVPARSGSKGLKNKNIKHLAGKPLISYSIEFAKRLKCIDRLICSTDSNKYAEIAEEYGAEVPFLRSEFASSDTAMEQDILKDLREQFKINEIDEPDIVVWLRPTFIFRSQNDIENCIKKLVNDEMITSSRVVCESENRLYEINDEKLLPLFNDNNKSMIRRQDMPKGLKVFSTDVIRFKNNNFDDDFLGRNVYAIETNKLCGLDIDDELDFLIVESIIKSGIIDVDKYIK